MFKHGNISTETDRRPFVFTLTAFLGSLLAAILVLVFGRGQGLAVFAGILLLIVALAAAAVLFAMVTDKAYIQDDTLHMQYLFRKAKIPLDGIARVTYKDQVYSVYDKKGKLAGTINGQLKGIDSILYQLDRNGIPFV